MKKTEAENGFRPFNPTVVEALRQRAGTAPHAPALVFLKDGETEAVRLDSAALHERAAALGAALDDRGLRGERVLLLLPQSAEFVVAFLGCLYAGAVPVPLYPPGNGRRAGTLGRIAQDCAPRLALVTASRIGAARAELPGDCDVADVESLRGVAGPGPGPQMTADPDDVAYLQYTSGSTGTPKGVMVTHRNVLHQADVMGAALHLGPGDHTVSWLPLFHDMGLIGGLLYPLLRGAATVLMTPAAFVQRPVRWLRAISDHRATNTFAATFALDLCAAKVPAEDIRTLDLAHLRSLVVGAEPIRAETLERFAAAFAPSGFDQRMIMPGYGMAEATLAVTLRSEREPLIVTTCSTAELRRGRLRTGPTDGDSRRLVSTGHPSLDTRMLIVDPDSGTERPDGEEGEIWLAGTLVAAGYWQRPEETAATFGARLADGSGPYLRTGDLAVRWKGQTYITGRLKDLIIVRGANHHPQDVERAATAVHDALAANRVIAFGADAGGEERLVVVQELDRRRGAGTDPAELVRLIRAAVTQETDLSPYAVVLLKPGTLPVTTSGKVRRRECRELYLAGRLEAVHTWSAADATGNPPPTAVPGARELTDWLVDRMARATGLPPAEVHLDTPFGALGLDSMSAVTVSGELQALLGVRVDPMQMYDHPTIARLSAALAGSPSAGPTPAVRAPAAPPGDGGVAVIGMACRLPGAPDVDEFWRLLVDGRDAVTPIPDGRWPAARWFRAGPPVPGRTNTGRAGLLDDVDVFDAGFFGISAVEAASMDPQQRLLISTTWRALEDAGIAPGTLAGSRTGVYVGISGTDYRQIQERDHAGADAHAPTGGALSIAANRISYHFDLTGPSQAIDTACSSSLVAVHQACAALRSGEIDAAVVGGVNLLLDPVLSVALSQAGMMAPDGRCKAFDAAADGYVRGEGCVVLVLRRPADTTADRVHAVIRGSAVNQDGRSSSLTAPSGVAQQAVIRQALAAAGVDPADVGYVEAHGTGTRLGDPIEVGALRAVYAPPGRTSPFRIGSVKTNIGHLEAAAGLAGLLKAVLTVRYGRIPATLHLRELNPLLPVEDSPISIPVSTVEWPEPSGRRLAAVSSFGFGGTNAHVVVQQAASVQVPARPIGDTTGWQVLVISARSEQALRTLAERHADRLATTEAGWAAFCHAAGSRRDHHGHRLAVVARTTREAARLLAGHLRGDRSPQVVTGVAGRPGEVALLFPGQGAQHQRMARALYFRYAGFRAALEECDGLVTAELGVSLLPTLCGGADEPVDLRRTEYAQPALFMVDYALAVLWQAAGVRPDAVLGHSLGEYVAACVAGVLSVADAVRLVVLRGRAMQEDAPEGVVYAVHSSPEVIAELSAELAAGDGTVTVAAVNGPEDVAVAAGVHDGEAFARRWTARGARLTRLIGERAFHSPAVAAAARRLTEAAGVTHRPGRIPVISNVTGQDSPVVTEGLDYWVRHSLAPVRFDGGLRTLVERGFGVFVECGPHPVLTTTGQRTAPDAVWLSSLNRREDDDRSFVAGLARWYVGGGTIDWAGLHRERHGPRVPEPGPVPLPAYPLAGGRHWYTPGRPVAAGDHPVLGSRIELAGSDESRFAQTLTATTPWFLTQHLVHGSPVLPGAATVEAMLSATGADVLESVRLTAPVVVTGAPVDVQTVVTGTSVTCYQRGDDAWTAFAAAATGAAPAGPAGPDPREGLLARLTEADTESVYRRLAAAGLDYGPAFRGVRRLWSGGAEALGLIEVPDAEHDGGTYRAHPVVLDACLHTVAALLPDLREAWLPAAVARVIVAGPLPGRVWAHARQVGRNPAGLVVSLAVRDEDGQLLLELCDLVLRRSAPGHDPVATWTVGWPDLPDAPVASPERGPWLAAGDPATVDAWSREDGVEIVPADRPDAGVRGLLYAAPRAGADVPDRATAVAGDAIRVLRDFLSAHPRGEVILCSAGAVAPAGGDVDPAQSVPAALARALTAEYPENRVVHADLDDPAVGLRGVIARAGALGGCGHLARRGDHWYTARLRRATSAGEGPVVRPDATYLITGGSGAIGSATARWLVARGARNLVLARRTAGDPAMAGELRARGVRVEVVSADVTDPGAVTRLLASVAAGLPPLRGIVHAAGVAGDLAFEHLDGAAAEAVLRPKVHGAWNLHRAAQTLDLDFFWLYSSLAATAGSAGQAGYVVANGFLDALAVHRRALGLPAVSIAWGPWAGPGMASGLEARMRRRGITPLDPDAAVTMLGRCGPGVPPHLVVADADWTVHLAGRGRPDTLFADLAQVSLVTSPDDLASAVAGDPGGAVAAISAGLLDRVGALLGLGAAERRALSPTFTRLRLSEMGLDSLLAVRLRNSLLADLDVDVPPQLFFGDSTVADVVAVIHRQLALRGVAGDDVADTADMEVLTL